MSLPKIKDQFTNLPISNQRKWQKRKKAAGRCILCGAKRNLYWNNCDACQDKIREVNRTRAGFKAWQPGGRGRPPVCHSIKNPIQKAA